MGDTPSHGTTSEKAAGGDKGQLGESNVHEP
jgi:hypothetical protein